MKVLLLFPLAALVMALALPVPSKPLWTVEMRLSGASAANRSVTDALGLPGEVTLLGPGALFRVAGVENSSTPGPDWIAEVREVADMPQVVRKLAAQGRVDDEGRFVVGEGEPWSFVAWQESATTLRLASSPGVTAMALPDSTPLKDGVWLAAWVDLSRMAPDAIRSTTLKLPRSLRVIASDTTGGTAVELGATLASEALAGQTEAVVKALRSAIGGAEHPLPPVDVSVQGTEVTVALRLTDAEVRQVLADFTASPAGK